MKIQKFNNLSIQNFIALMYALVIVSLVSIIGIISYVITSRTVDENTNEYVLQLVEQINYDIDYYLRNVENTMYSVMANEDIIDYFYVDTNEAEFESDKISTELNGYMKSRNDIINIFLVREDGQITVNSGNYTIKPDLDIKESVVYQETILSDETIVSNSHIQDMIVDRYKWVVTWSSKILNESNSQVIGMVLVDLNFNIIEDMLANLSLGEKGYMFIIDEDGDIIYHPKHELIYSGIKREDIDSIVKSEDGYIKTYEEGRAKNYIVATSEYTKWKVVGAVYEDELQPYDFITRQIYVLMSALAIILAIILSIIISRHYLYPIKDLSKGMEEFKLGNLDARVRIEMDNEFGDLADDFNDMTIQIKQLIIENQQKEKAKRKFELKSLQSQINPHFLYNTLDSIVWMGEAEMNEEVVKMTYALSKLFRISINRGSEFVTLEQEIEHIESYLLIQKIRYGDKLDYSIQVDESLISIRIIKIIIQPIVENAIYHGIKKLAGNGKIDISVYQESGNICIKVTDNGVGMDEDTLNSLTDNNHSRSKAGIGVKNVDERLKLYYGERYGVHIESEIFVGTSVTLTIPKEYLGKEHQNERNNEGS